MASIKLNSYNVITQSGDDAPEIIVKTPTTQTFVIKGIDAPIVGATNSSEDNPNSGQLAIYNGDTKLWGINESGWVVNPNVPAFTAFGSGGTTTVTAGNVIPFTNLQFGTDYYNTTNSTFTAPIDGKYLFQISAYLQGAASFCFYKNGSRVGSPNPLGYKSSADENDSQRYISTILSLSAGDYVTANSRDTQSTVIYLSHSTFSGSLLG